MIILIFYSALESLIHFAYSGKVLISTSNVQSLLEGASYLQLAKVREACCDFLRKRYYVCYVSSYFSSYRNI